MARRKLDLVKGISEALEGWEKMPKEKQEIQLQFQLAVELSAIKQGIELGILDADGEISDKTTRLIREAQCKSLM